VFALPATDDLSLPLQPPRVTVVTVVATPSMQHLVAELRRESMQVEVATASVLDHEPVDPVYVVCLDAAFARLLAERFVSWAATELHAGLIGVVEDGRPTDNETLLAAGFDDVIAAPFSTPASIRTAAETAGKARCTSRPVAGKNSRAGSSA